MLPTINAVVNYAENEIAERCDQNAHGNLADDRDYPRRPAARLRCVFVQTSEREIAAGGGCEIAFDDAPESNALIWLRTRLFYGLLTSCSLRETSTVAPVGVSVTCVVSVGGASPCGSGIT